jgi:hypothetical protein
MSASSVWGNIRLRHLNLVFNHLSHSDYPLANLSRQTPLAMLLFSLTLFSLLALTARSFLLPPSFQVDATVLDTVNAVVNARLLKLDCPGCLFAESDGSGNGYHWDENVENSLVRCPPSGGFRNDSYNICRRGMLNSKPS